MRELTTPADIADATDDPLMLWGAQALTPDYRFPGGRAWALDGAMVIYAPALYRRDRLLVTGPGAPAAKLLSAALADLPEALPCARTEVVEGLRGSLPGIVDYATFGWMDTRTASPAPGQARWLTPGELDRAAELIQVANGDSWVIPGEPDTRRWAGLFDGSRLVSVAGDAWPSPGVGFIAGVATHPDFRGRGASSAVCRFVRDELVAEHGCCGLMVYGDNAVAIRLYERLGFTYRSMTAFGLSA